MPLRAVLSADKTTEVARHLAVTEGEDNNNGARGCVVQMLFILPVRPDKCSGSMPEQLTAYRLEQARCKKKEQDDEIWLRPGTFAPGWS